MIKYEIKMHFNTSISTQTCKYSSSNYLIVRINLYNLKNINKKN